MNDVLFGYGRFIIFSIDCKNYKHVLKRTTEIIVFIGTMKKQLNILWLYSYNYIYS